MRGAPFADDNRSWKVKEGVRYWDDGFGPLWVYEESFGIVGVVRARTEEEAYLCVEDEIMDGCTWDEMVQQHDLSPSKAEALLTTGNLPEGCRFRSSGVPSSKWAHGEIACEDLNFSRVRLMDREDAEKVGFVWLREHFRKGEVVRVKPNPTGDCNKWLTAPQPVKLLEDASCGGWDVYDVELSDGQEVSLYGFNIEPREEPA